ncbi:MAG: DUF2577 family protein [Aminipila sp.]
MDGITELAKLFKDRNNPSIQGVCIGKVVASFPDIKITLNGLMLDKTRIVVASHLTKTYVTSSQSVGDHGAHTHTISDSIKSGDRVIVVPSIDNSMYFVLDKVGDI